METKKANSVRGRSTFHNNNNKNNKNNVNEMNELSYGHHHLDGANKMNSFGSLTSVGANANGNANASDHGNGTVNSAGTSNGNVMHHYGDENKMEDGVDLHNSATAMGMYGANASKRSMRTRHKSEQSNHNHNHNHNPKKRKREYDNEYYTTGDDSYGVKTKHRNVNANSNGNNDDNGNDNDNGNGNGNGNDNDNDDGVNNNKDEDGDIDLESGMTGNTSKLTKKRKKKRIANINNDIYNRCFTPFVYDQSTKTLKQMDHEGHTDLNVMEYHCINIQDIKQQCKTHMGDQLFTEYMHLCQRYLQCELSKWEFDYLFRTKIGKKFVRLHNCLIHSLSWNAKVKSNQLRHKQWNGTQVIEQMPTSLFERVLHTRKKLKQPQPQSQEQEQEQEQEQIKVIVTNVPTYKCSSYNDHTEIRTCKSVANHSSDDTMKQEQEERLRKQQLQQQSLPPPSPSPQQQQQQQQQPSANLPFHAPPVQMFNSVHSNPLHSTIIPSHPPPPPPPPPLSSPGVSDFSLTPTPFSHSYPSPYHKPFHSEPKRPSDSKDVSLHTPQELSHDKRHASALHPHTPLLFQARPFTQKERIELYQKESVVLSQKLRSIRKAFFAIFFFFLFKKKKNNNNNNKHSTCKNNKRELDLLIVFKYQNLESFHLLKSNAKTTLNT
ncbi:hypothetical protein RFI_09787 [Reticulomyxa filosa]|uniref:Uncharacterized protein n=1 Tax=Reticulomyxa filosa TaxID=46433 RepID=X6NNR4_RETFI|nr:hypothetical protein RFI_09787 [Reticulomyxa filosa]|eukprot:ETO27349.1 hypothetical protein RFI_09787 [Reticulomyxa filosa]